MLSLTPDTVLQPGPAVLTMLARSMPLRDAKHLFIGALVAPVAIAVLARGWGLQDGRLYGLVVASALTAAVAPLLASAYCADALRRLQSSASEPDRLDARCRRMHGWTRIAAFSLFTVAASINLTLLWAMGSLALGFWLWDPSLVPALRCTLVVGLCGLAWADAVLGRA